MRQPTTETITWMPYPEKGPESGGVGWDDYLVTRIGPDGHTRMVEETRWNRFAQFFDVMGVTAFAEMPKGYGGEE